MNIQETSDLIKISLAYVCHIMSTSIKMFTNQTINQMCYSTFLCLVNPLYIFSTETFSLHSRRVVASDFISVAYLFIIAKMMVFLTLCYNTPVLSY